MTSPDQYVFRRLYVPPTDIFRTDDDLLKKIIKQGQSLFSHDSTTAFQLDPSHAHNIVGGSHKVVWYVDQDQGRYTNWDEFTSCDRTLDSIDERNSDNSSRNSEYMSYIMVGHGRDNPGEEHRPKRRLSGLASKQFPHVHEQFKLIPKNHEDDRHIKLTDPLGRRTLETQSNLAMDLTLSCITHLLTDFGTRFEYSETIGIGAQKLSFTHTAFGFSNMSKAIKSTHEVIKKPEIKMIWPSVIESVASHKDDMLPHGTRVRPGFQLNGMVLHPSAPMRERLSPTGDFDTWVLLASDGGFSLFVEDGITFDRDL